MKHIFKIKYVGIVCIIVCIFILVFLSTFFITNKNFLIKNDISNFNLLNQNELNSNELADKNEKFKESEYLEDELQNLEEKLNNNTFEIWTIKIEAIDLFAKIKHGTAEEILNKYIGHFEETNFFNGNVGLAAHNRGYPVNYFENLDKLKIGDIIEYRIDDYLKKYKVKSIEIIRDTDWTYLKNTKDDRITLITCVKNKPEYRLCVQAHKESEEFLNNAENDAESVEAKEICCNKFDNNFIIKYSFSRCG